MTRHISRLHSLLLLLLLPLSLMACSAVETDIEASAAVRQQAVQEHIDGLDSESLDVFFVPGGQLLEDRIADEVSKAQRQIRVAMYNIRSARLGYALLERQRAGVDVQVLWDAKQMAKEYNTLDDELMAAGLNVVPVMNNRYAYATMHDKLVVIDGRVVMMGSANWGNSALHNNNESVLVFSSSKLAQVVSGELDEILSGALEPRAQDTDSAAQMYFSPEDHLDKVVEAQIDAAQHRIVAAVFSLRLRSLAKALIRAKNRGVEVFVVTDLKQSSTTSVDELLKDAGIPVVEALNDTTEYTAMHHKFMVVDGKTTVVGSYNWTYTATRSNYENLAVLADNAEVAAAYEGEFGRVWERYGSGANPVTTTMTMQVRALYRDTSPGDTLVLVGDRPELGAWDPMAGIRLSGEQWPTWTGSVALRAGSKFAYKLVVVRADGRVEWERGENRTAVTPTDPTESMELAGSFRE